MKMNNGNLPETINRLYDFMAQHLYLGRPDLFLNGSAYNAALLMGVLTGLCGGKELIIGEPGLGKTTSAEYICSLLHRIPLGIVWGAEVAGHPEQTEEKIVGRPDLGQLNQGREVVVWSHFSLLTIKIVDEINRLPETKQSLILNGVDRGHWEYLDQTIFNHDFCLFATANYQDQGTNTIIGPLMDRFDIMVESKHPGANLAYTIGQTTSTNRLRHRELEDEYRQILGRRIEYDEKLGLLEEISERFGGWIKKEYELDTISLRQREAIREQMDALPLDPDANAFVRFVISELSFCYHFGQKRSHESCEDGCHFSNYLCRQLKNCISNRFPTGLLKYARGLAWFTGADEVDLEHIKTVLPHTLAHRLSWREEAVARLERRPRRDPLEIFMAAEAVREMHRRFQEQEHLVKKALAVAARIADGRDLAPVEGDHPLYHDIQRDLGLAEAVE